MNIKLPVLFLLLLTLGYSSQGQNRLRSIEVLTEDSTGWPVVKQWVNSAKNNCEILPVDSRSAKDALYQTQVTTHSIMGAIIYNSGGLLIDKGWIRILGAGNSKLKRSLPGWNKGETFREYGEVPTFLLIGDDALGGFFALNGGALGPDKGNVYYLAPETLKWESLGKGYSDFLNFCLNGDLNAFYKRWRWKDGKTT